jgi:hypothetical protein
MDYLMGIALILIKCIEFPPFFNLPFVISA